MRRVAICLCVSFALCVSPARAASLFDPAHRYRTISTPHFVIHFHQGEDALAARLAVIAEDVWRELSAALGPAPPRTQVVVADEAESANGSATPLPYDTVIITAAWPSGSEFIGNTDDWLRLVFTHEFTHIAHLDRSRSWARAVRDVFGRNPIAFPNLFLPTWQIEGIATYEESAQTGYGRLHAGDFLGITREAAREGRPAPLDRANGGLTDWPGGLAPYAYGAGFHAYLADRFGAAAFRKLADDTAGRVPYTSSPLFRGLFGASLGELWRDYERALEAAAPGPAPTDPGLVRLTHHGFYVTGPRYAGATCGGCAAEIVYALSSPRAFPTLRALTIDTHHDRRLTTRYAGSTSAVGRGTLVFDQQDLHRNTSLYSDLYAYDRVSGHVRRLTHGERLLDPDLSPDEQTIVAVQAHPGRRDLVLVRLKPDTTAAPTSAIPMAAPAESGFSRIRDVITLVSEPDTQFAAPRWAPGGRTIAVERHRLGTRSEIVLVDEQTRAVTIVAGGADARVVTPAWRPDGRAIVAAAARDGEPFNLFEFALNGEPRIRQLTHMTGGAIWPDVAADGKHIVFAGQSADGFDLFEVPYPTHAAGTDTVAVQDFSPAALAMPAPPVSPAPPAPTSSYSPLPTLPPTFWSPIVTGDAHQLRIGAATAGADVLRYHAYAASATWLATAPDGPPLPNRAAPDWSAAYAYDRWRPTFWAAASEDTSFFDVLPSSQGQVLHVTRRERELAAGVLVPFTHVRISQAAAASFVRTTDEDTIAAGMTSRNRSAIRGAWLVNSAHTFGYSIGPERGLTAGATIEAVRQAFGASGDATSVTGDARTYLPGAGANHVVALRVAAGATSGDIDVGRAFTLGGAAPNLSPVDFGSGAMDLLRGFDADEFAGTRIAVANAEYRLPLFRPQRGIGTLPVFLHTIHAAAFADAGDAWVGTFDRRMLKTAVGAELSTNIVVGYGLPLTVTGGVAWTRNGATAERGAAAYVRIGRSF